MPAPRGLCGMVSASHSPRARLGEGQSPCPGLTVGYVCSMGRHVRGGRDTNPLQGSPSWGFCKGHPANVGTMGSLTSGIKEFIV